MFQSSNCKFQSLTESQMNSYQAISLAVLVYISSGQTFSLNGEWIGYIGSLNTTSEAFDENVTSFKAIVPGGIYTDLSRSGIIPENLFRNNDVANRWVGNRSVAYAKTFKLDNKFLEANSSILTFHGLDTFARISVNDEYVGNTSNMFVRYQYDIRKYLKPGSNELRVTLWSPVQKAAELYALQSKKYIVPPNCVPDSYNGECHVNHIRKMQSSFAWDWGPAFPSVGIWKDVELVAAQAPFVTDVVVEIQKQEDIWNLVVTVFLDTLMDEGQESSVCEIFADITITDYILISNTLKTTFKTRSANASLTLNIPSRFVKKWWPNGYGNQQLYPVSVNVTTSDGTIHRSLQVGFRTIELVQEPLLKGLSFYFKVNDIPIFAKGSNWIPASVFPELSNDETTVRKLLKSAKDTHMNMLRVWGGGLYESDLFYKIADEYGIMIWQDFMFACSMYPTTNEFLESVRMEVRQNVRRLQHHASIVLWAGNNENEAALYGNWYGTGKEKIYEEDYVKLYVDVIKNEVEKLDQTRPFVVSSPSDGLHTEDNNYFGPNPYSNLYGDVHYYNYINNGWNIYQYPRTRFASEYGLQSLPSIHTLMTATKDQSDLQLNSSFMQHRQHLPNGYKFMNSLISMNFEIPNTNNATSDLIRYIYLSQINQAVSIKIETESYRQARTTVNVAGEGMTMGALYWQLNDVWQAPSWSSIEFGGRWKMLHYYAAEFFAPVIISPCLSAADDLELYVVSDQLTVIEGCKLAINIYKWDSLTPIHTHNSAAISIPPNAAKLVATTWLEDYLRAAGCGELSSAKKNCVMQLVLTDIFGFEIAPCNYVFPTQLKKVSLPKAHIEVNVEPYPTFRKNSNSIDFKIDLSTNNIALFIWLDLGESIGGRFSENGFHMFNANKSIVFYADENTTAEVIKSSLSITTLSDVHTTEKNLDYSVTAV